jgi:uncharacterized protein YbjT (DUF2867 family)
VADGRVLVFAASGYIGSHLVPRLVAAGRRVRAAARHQEVLEGRGWEGVERVAANALRPESLGPALDGVKVAYYLVHSMAAGRHFPRLDREAAAHFRDAAATAGVGRIVYLGGLQPRGETSAHLASRRETGEVLRAGPVPVTEIRAGMIVGPGSAAFEVIRDLVYHLPVMVTPRWVRTRSQPIALDDLLAYLEAVPGIEATAGGVYDVGGPEVLTYEDLIRRFAAAVGKRPLILPVPVLTPRLSSYWLDLVTAVPSNVARALVEGLAHDVLADDAPLRALLPLPLKTFDEAVEAALRAEREAAVPARWTEGALAFRNYRPDYAFYAKKVRAESHCAAPPPAVWEQVAALGGENGWPFAHWLWRLRGWLDRLVGGVGMRRGRRHPRQVRVGDALDYWRVVAVAPPERLTLVAEMRMPGAAVLEFSLAPEDDGGTRLVMAGHFHPAGVWGLLYWYATLPVHGWLFRGMVRTLAARAAARKEG